MKKINNNLALLTALCVALLFGCSKQEAPAPSESVQVSSPALQNPDKPAETNSPFVTVEGNQFFRNGQPYYVIGTNFWYGGYLGSVGDVGDRERLIKELDLLQKTGINNLRVLAASESSELMRAVRPAIIKAPGEYDETLLAGMDFLLDEMAKRDMTAILYLNNFWQWSGGMSQYVSWFTGKPVFDPDVTNEWNPFMENSASFYRIEEAQKLYRDVIKSIITRKNTINGKLYSEDPTIMSWQLANEPRPGSDADGRVNIEAFKSWIHGTAKYIDSLAPNQLVSTGNEGSMGAIRDMDLFIDSHKSEYVDYLTFHMWVKNWGWYDAKNPDETFSSALATAKDYINQHIDVANQMNKPIVLEEFGIERDNGSFTTDSTTVYRDRFYAEIFNLLRTRAGAGDAIAGMNFWAWGGYGRTENEDFMWKEGDDFVGDPPQEPQGLNSVFDVDTTTLAVIKAHADAMKDINTKQ
ncbi:cellulase family glycosylhydrolase [Cellvibrio sp. PSBB006]|uniref:glycoside hydrolase 5 family protein n=1 Tax=Cellvibrio sp. PSBB006 TaxID=1987723 RepID=UPI000B3B927A|nr:cellulase family glycosylhydrolase [Cellvibrio sp. PSBB006]ARU28676.1 mannanase [Cellvibrio sp. PSBB006]